MELNPGWFALVVHVSVVTALIVRVLLRPHRDPASRIAWITIILALPIVGALAYLMVGEVRMGRQRRKHLVEAQDRLPDPESLALGDETSVRSLVPQRYQHLFRVGQSISGFEPSLGNSARLLPDSNAAIDAMVADIDEARESVHVLFYIWLADNNGLKVVAALQRAAARGVTCRAMVDDLGSRALVRSSHWQAMGEAGVKLARALPLGRFPLLTTFVSRIDLRNHRKIVVIDGRLTYCGSQNCADPEFRVKARYAPWVDLMVRFEGPVALQNQYLFVSDWMAAVGEDISEVISSAGAPAEVAGGIPAQVIGTGPTLRYSAMPEMFESLFHAARHDIVISTPYFVPDEAMIGALCAAAWRAVDTTLILPARNDSWMTGAASRSYYHDLLEAGVHLYEYGGGLLHAKTLTIDGDLTLIGSANMDRRSFDLNYENNILFFDPVFTALIRNRQEEYIDASHFLTEEEVDAWSLPRRAFQNAMGMLGPVI